MKAIIKGIEYYLPEKIITNEDLNKEFPDWTVDDIAKKTGIDQRHIAAKDELSSDLGVQAAKKLFSSKICSPEDIDFILLCTQSPDYYLPTSACIIQKELGLKNSCGALDFNLGCSGFVYGLGIAKGLIETNQAKNVLLITAETYSKFIHPKDKGNRTIFGDAAAATLIQGSAHEDEMIGPFIYGTDGEGAENLIVKRGGMRYPKEPSSIENETPTDDNIVMKGGEIFAFSLTRIPQAFRSILDHAKLSSDDIDLFVFHQANKYMLDHLKRKLKLPDDKFFVCMNKMGNTVSSTIPIAIKNAILENKIRPGMRILLLGFGVGYSWGATIVKWGK